MTIYLLLHVKYMASGTAIHTAAELYAESAYVLRKNLGLNVGRYVMPKRR